jgi:hypothetical protein
VGGAGAMSVRAKVAPLRGQPPLWPAARRLPGRLFESACQKTSKSQQRYDLGRIRWCLARANSEPNIATAAATAASTRTRNTITDLNQPPLRLQQPGCIKAGRTASRLKA